MSIQGCPHGPLTDGPCEQCAEDAAADSAFVKPIAGNQSLQDRIESTTNALCDALDKCPCRACSIEAEIRTEEIPHPICRAIHTCVDSIDVKWGLGDKETYVPRMAKPLSISAHRQLADDCREHMRKGGSATAGVRLHPDHLEALCDEVERLRNRVRELEGTKKKLCGAVDAERNGRLEMARALYDKTTDETPWTLTIDQAKALHEWYLSEHEHYTPTRDAQSPKRMAALSVIQELGLCDNNGEWRIVVPRRPMVKLPPPGCVLDCLSSRICERGTDCCTVDHGALLAAAVDDEPAYDFHIALCDNCEHWDKGMPCERFNTRECLHPAKPVPPSNSESSQ